MAVTVKMIKVGQRDCIHTREHTIPFDVVMHVEYSLPAGDEKAQATLLEVASPGQYGAKVHLGIQGSDPIKLDAEEARQLKNVLGRMG